MGAALIQLGYRVVGARLDTVEDLQAGRFDKVFELAKGFDAFQDVPWAALYKELDFAFPGSRFIFVERDEQEWLRSAVRHFNNRYYPMHEWLYGAGVLLGNETRYLERYRRHNKEVKDYFENRGNFLVFKMSDGDGWPELCRFLSKPVPRAPFPHENKRLHPLSTGERFLEVIRINTPLPLRRSVFRVRLWIRSLFGLPDPRDRFHNFEANRRRRKQVRR